MNERDLIYDLLYHSLIEIREEAHNTGNKKIYVMSDLIHNIPVKLKNILNNGSDDTEKSVLEHLKEDAEIRGITKWLENCLKQQP